MANMEQSQSFFTHEAPTCNIKSASGGWPQPYCDCTGCLNIDRTSVLSETHLGTTTYRKKMNKTHIITSLLHHLVSFLLVTQITRLKKSSKGVIYEESLDRRSALTWQDVAVTWNLPWKRKLCNFYSILITGYWMLSNWQLPVQPVMGISSKWRHFRFGDYVLRLRCCDRGRPTERYMLRPSPSCSNNAATRDYPVHLPATRCWDNPFN